jgi:Family of unknown function (DUF6491)
MLQVLCVAALTSCAAINEPAKSTPSISKEDCLIASAVEDWTPLDDERLIIFGAGRKAFLATLVFPSPDLRFGFQIAIVDGDNNGRICGHGSDAVVVDNATVPGRLVIQSLQPLEKSEVDAYLKKDVQPRKIKGVAIPAPQ